MKATDDLHRLLHSLTQNEKRYVKVFASKQSSGDNSNAMLLFDAILEQKEYDEQKLKDKLNLIHLSDNDGIKDLHIGLGKGKLSIDSIKDLIKLNPDSIFVVYMDRSDETVAQNEVDKVLENKALASLNAVKNNRVNSIALGEMYCSGIRTIDGINTFANGLYPQLNK